MDLLNYWWLLLALPVLFASGWGMARLESRQRNLAAQHTRAAYLRGLTHLLGERQDQAVDAFIEAVDRDPHTAELQFALANLFRRRGEYDRAVRLHENLIGLPDIAPDEREHARFELGMDYFKAGLFDRTVDTMSAVRSNYYRPRALEIVLQVRERLRQWDAAVLVARELERISTNSTARQVSHYHCEMAAIARKQQDAAAWQEHLRQASATPGDLATPTPARPLLMALEAAAEDAAAQQHWSPVLQLEQQLRQDAPEYLGLAAQRLLAHVRGQAVAAPLRDLWLAWLEQGLNLDVLDAVLQLSPESEQRALLLRWFAQRPLLPLTPRLLQSAAATLHEAEPPLAQALEQGAKTLQPAVQAALKYRCAACSFESRHFFWQCPGCLGWETMPPRRLGDAASGERLA